MTLGRLIVFEGIEGAGKTTQIQQAHQWLSSTLSRSVLLTREPGETPLGERLREVLLGDMAISPTAELLLYAADRAQHVEHFIKPALAEGKIVLCDRFTDSTIAYQGYGRGLSLPIIDQLNRIAAPTVCSDLTLWLDVEVETGLERMRQRGKADRMERADIQFHRRVQQGFATLAQTEGNPMVRIDANLSESQVWDQVRSVLHTQLSQWGMWE
ncbi:dTMP kinase [Roseofilum casamattae]|uniref:Thymidylate kinase n=1 Tax=Roseofilum casamattae BLCC-M143 TaxID=3022442 RepID=A0ABT7BVK8_9CYAN|nr:dTMP kinase [Roseofilum casamattae]MDJ1182496.1 dTMP kinase [Roseofilum casamattae BLCC-M143]